MPTPRADTYAIASGADLWAGRDAPSDPALAATQIVSDGVWTWFSDRRALYRNGATYFSYVRGNGDVAVARYVHATATVSEFTLSAALEVNDHNNGGLVFLPDGRIMACYSKHNDTSGTRYRISTNPEDISAWGSEVVLTVTTPASYSNPRYISATGKVYLHYRTGQGASNTQTNVRAYDVAAGTWDAQRTWISANTTPASTPYVISRSNGVDRIDFLFTDKHPVQGFSSVYHAYLLIDGSSETFYQSDGTLIGSPPIASNGGTLVYDGSADRAWIWDMLVSGGSIHVLISRFQSDLDHRLLYAKFNGLTWSTAVEIAQMGPRLYSGEQYYSGGACFDSQDPSKVFVSSRVANDAWELSELSTSDGGSSWSELRDITNSSGDFTVKNCRPISVDGHDGRIRALWWRGAYSTFISYNTAVWGVG